MKRSVVILLLLVATTAQAQVTAKGLILDLDADKGVEVEDGDRVVKWTNQVAEFPARDFVKQDAGGKEARAEGRLPEVLSVDLYRAVLDGGVRTPDDMQQWMQSNRTGVLTDWRPGKIS